MKNREKLSKWRKGLIGLGLIASSIPYNALAVLPKANPSGLAPSVDCSDACKIFKGTASALIGDMNTGLKGFVSSNTWNTKDDTLCSDVGQPTTDGNIVDRQLYQKKEENDPDLSSCEVPVTQQMWDNHFKGKNFNNSTICKKTSQIMDRCKYHNSQLENYCMTYLAIEGDGTDAYSTGVDENGNGTAVTGTISAKGANGSLLALNLAAAVPCWVACVLPIEPASWMACGAATTATGVLEMAISFAQKNSNVQKYLDEKGIPGLATGILGGVNTLAGGATVVESAVDFKDGFNSTAKKAYRAAACAQAVLATTLGVLRAANLGVMDSASKDACNNIKSLFGDNSGLTTTSGTSTGYTTSTSSGSGTGGGSGSGGSSGGISSSQLESFKNCINSGKKASECGTESGITMSATEGGLLDTKDLSTLLRQMPNPEDIVKKAMAEGTGAALGSMLPASMGGAAAGIAAMANDLQKDAANVAQQLGVPSPSAYSSGGGGGGGGAGAAKDQGLFGNLFGGGTSTGAGIMGDRSIASFGGAPVANDIWHANSSENLFEIISGKIAKVSNRVK